MNTTELETQLGALLTELSETQDELLAVLAEKRQCMVDADLDAMGPLRDRGERLQQRLQDCHTRRGELLAAAQRQGLPAESVKQLSAALPPDRDGTRRRQVDDASQRMRLIQHQSLTNWVLAQRTLLHLTQLLEIIATGGRLQPTYGDSASHRARGALVDQEV